MTRCCLLSYMVLGIINVCVQRYSLFGESCNLYIGCVTLRNFFGSALYDIIPLYSRNTYEVHVWTHYYIEMRILYLSFSLYASEKYDTYHKSSIIDRVILFQKRRKQDNFCGRKFGSQNGRLDNNIFICDMFNCWLQPCAGFKLNNTKRVAAISSL